jgi:hypothetical protein
LPKPATLSAQARLIIIDTLPESSAHCNGPSSTVDGFQMTDFQTDSDGLQLYLEKLYLPPPTSQSMTCLHLTASTYALIPDLKSCDELNGEEEKLYNTPK